MSFTYDVTDLDTALAKVRFEIGDTTSTAALFTDEEIELKLADNADNVLKTAADLCDVLATRFARDFDFSTDNQSFSRSQMAAMYKDRASELRKRGEGAAVNVQAYRIDGYSDDTNNRTSSGGSDRAYRGPYYYDRKP